MRYGLVSSGAVRRVSPGRGSNVNDTGTGPVGAVSSDHINNPEQQRAGKGFSNAEQDFGSADLGHIDQRINARQWQVRARGKNPFTTRTWKPEWFDTSARWFDWQSRTKWDGSRGTPPNPDSASGGRMDGEPGVTGQSALARSRRGET
jgi:hypothetical protein